MNVLVTDGICPSTPAIIESLGKLGHQVFCCEETKWNASFFSKYVHKGIVTPSSENEPEKYRQALLDIIEEQRIDILIPVRDAAINVVVKERDSFSQIVKLLLPEYEDWLNGASKIRTMKLAAENNFAIPKTYFKEEHSYEYLASELGIPFLIKLEFSSGTRGVFSIENEKRFNELIGQFSKQGIGYYYQEKIPLGGRSLSPSYIYNYDHELIAWFLYEQLRTYPVNGGTTSFGMSIYDEKILLDGKALLDKMNWIGPAGIDILQDPRDGVYKILEINPRFWTPLLLAIRSGVDFPHIMLDIITGFSTEKVLIYKEDLTYSFLPYELIHLFKKQNLNILKSMVPSQNHHDVFINVHDPALLLGLIFQMLFILFKKRDRYIHRGEV